MRSPTGVWARVTDKKQRRQQKHTTSNRPTGTAEATPCQRSGGWYSIELGYASQDTATAAETQHPTGPRAQPTQHHVSVVVAGITRANAISIELGYPSYETATAAETQHPTGRWAQPKQHHVSVVVAVTVLSWGMRHKTQRQLQKETKPARSQPYSYWQQSQGW